MGWACSCLLNDGNPYLITRTSWAHVWTQMSYSIELVFVLCESPPLTGISHDKPSFLLTFHFLLLPQHNFSKSYHKQCAIIPILIWMCWIFSFFWRFIAILMSLIFWLLELCQSVWSISFCPLQLNLFIITLKWPHLPSTKQTHIIIQGPIFQIFLARRYMFRLIDSAISNHVNRLGLYLLLNLFVLQLRWLKLHLIKQTRVILLRVIYFSSSCTLNSHNSYNFTKSYHNPSSRWNMCQDFTKL